MCVIQLKLKAANKKCFVIPPVPLGLVSLFNGISTSAGYLMPRPFS